MPVHHVKGQPAASTYVQKKGCITFDTNRATPCSFYHSYYSTDLGFYFLVACGCGTDTQKVSLTHSESSQ